MPKVKPLGNPTMKITQELGSKDWRKDDARIADEMQRLHYESKRTHREIAEMLGLNSRTWLSYISNPSLMRLPMMRDVAALGKKYGVRIDFLESWDSEELRKAKERIVQLEERVENLTRLLASLGAGK